MTNLPTITQLETNANREARHKSKDKAVNLNHELKDELHKLFQNAKYRSEELMKLWHIKRAIINMCFTHKEENKHLAKIYVAMRRQYMADIEMSLTQELTKGIIADYK